MEINSPSLVDLTNNHLKQLLTLLAHMRNTDLLLPRVIVSRLAISLPTSIALLNSLVESYPLFLMREQPYCCMRCGYAFKLTECPLGSTSCHDGSKLKIDQYRIVNIEKLRDCIKAYLK